MTNKAQFSAEVDNQGAFVRQESIFRNWVSADGSTNYLAEPDRYHLYVSYACPWAHRTIIVRKLKDLESVISMSVVDPIRDERGWAFRDGPDCSYDPINGFSFLREAYTATKPDFEGRITVPVLWDKHTKRIVNNESADIIRMLNCEFNAYGNHNIDLYPQAMRSDIDALNKEIYRSINNGVYRAEFATSQRAYDRAYDRLFDMLDQLEQRLAKQRYLMGDRVTLADWRLFTTLVRFDAVYYSHFKCNRQRLIDYPSLWNYVLELYQIEGVATTVNMDHIKRHYYITHNSINPNGIVPKGPVLNFLAPHSRNFLVNRDSWH